MQFRMRGGGTAEKCARDHTSVAALNHSPVLNALAAAVRSMAPGMGISGICLAACHTAAA